MKIFPWTGRELCPACNGFLNKSEGNCEYFNELKIEALKRKCETCGFKFHQRLKHKQEELILYIRIGLIAAAISAVGFVGYEIYQFFVWIFQ